MAISCFVWSLTKRYSNNQSNVFLSFAFSPQSGKQQALLLIFIIYK